MKKSKLTHQSKLLLVVLFTSISSFSFAGQSIESESDNYSAEIHKFLTSDGHFDLKAVQRSGYQGPLNWEGYDIQLDPITGEPMMRPQRVTPGKDHPDDIYWDNTLSPSIPGVDGYVNAITTYNGLLIIGGSFSVA